MQIIKNLQTFLYDKNYCLNIFENKIHIFRYQELLELKEENIIIRMDTFLLNIFGSELRIMKMTDEELLIVGNILKLEFKK